MVCYQRLCWIFWGYLMFVNVWNVRVVVVRKRLIDCVRCGVRDSLLLLDLREIQWSSDVYTTNKESRSLEITGGCGIMRGVIRETDGKSTAEGKEVVLLYKI